LYYSVFNESFANPAQFWPEPDISRICKKRPDFGRSRSQTPVQPYNELESLVIIVNAWSPRTITASLTIHTLRLVSRGPWEVYHEQ